MNEIDPTVEAVGQVIAEAKRALSTLSAHVQSHRRDALLLCLTEAIELARGAFILGNQPLVSPHAVIARATFERLIRAAWACLSEENAQAYLQAGALEVLRQARKEFRLGYARMFDPTTASDRTREVLDRIGALSLQPPESFESLAKQAGLEAIHVQFYGFFSLLSHGNTAGLYKEEPEVARVALLASTAACLRAVSTIGFNWVRQSRPTTLAELANVLGVGPA
jgi:hypothetical protein